MQELKKILEEIDREKKNVALSTKHTTEYVLAQIRMAERIEEIICKHMNDGWIPVEERLPEPYQQVLVSMYNNIKYVTIGHYDDYGKKWKTKDWITGWGVDVKAWRLLPEPYWPERREQ